jgi:hypothetical protein
MQRMQLRQRQELITLEAEETFEIPTNCWAFIEMPDGRKQMIQETTVQGSDVSRLILTPRIAGG